MHAFKRKLLRPGLVGLCISTLMATLGAVLLTITGCTNSEDQLPLQAGAGSSSSNLDPMEDQQLKRATAFREAVVNYVRPSLESVRLSPISEDIEFLISTSEMVVDGTITKATLAETPRTAQGPMADPGLSAIWLLIHVKPNATLGPQAQVDSNDQPALTWASVLWTGQESERATALAEIKRAEILDRAQGLNTILFLHKSRIVPDWWSTSNGAGAIIWSGNDVTSLDERFKPSSTSTFGQPSKLWDQAVQQVRQSQVPPGKLIRETETFPLPGKD